MNNKMNKWIGKFHRGDSRKRKGFTLIELLVVVAILGVLAAVAVPNVGKFIKSGQTQALAAELHNIQTGTMALLADSKNGALDAAASGVTDMTTVLADGGTKNLATYLTGLDAANKPKTGANYDFTTDGKVTQHAP